MSHTPYRSGNKVVWIGRGTSVSAAARAELRAARLTLTYNEAVKEDGDRNYRAVPGARGFCNL